MTISETMPPIAPLINPFVVGLSAHPEIPLDLRVGKLEIGYVDLKELLRIKWLILNCIYL